MNSSLVKWNAIEKINVLQMTVCLPISCLGQRKEYTVPSSGISDRMAFFQPVCLRSINSDYSLMCSFMWQSGTDPMHNSSLKQNHKWQRHCIMFSGVLLDILQSIICYFLHSFPLLQYKHKCILLLYSSSKIVIV